MAIYEITADALRKIDETSFSQEGVKERGDLQRLLRTQIDVISPDTLVIAEEFGEWQDSKRRIDLLAIDKDANLIVVELKRDEDGGHMELQAIRYAAMVSTMTFARAIEVYTDYLAKIERQLDARESLLDFLDWTEPDEDRFGQDVRMILASAEFSKELTTAVMWLNDRDVDIRCIRMKPYRDEGKVLVDVQQVIPLPEAAAYQVQIREKGRRERKDRAERYGVRKRFWSKLLAYAHTKTDLHANISPNEYAWVGTGSGFRGLGYNYAVTQHAASVELYIDRGPGCEAENKQIFDGFHSQKDQIESRFGGALSWQRLDSKQACRIRCSFEEGGYRADELQWQMIFERLVDAMIRLEQSLSPHIEGLKSIG
jgi:hypothetical protein